jgi:hypothetical protein
MSKESVPLLPSSERVAVPRELSRTKAESFLGKLQKSILGRALFAAAEVASIMPHGPIAPQDSPQEQPMVVSHRPSEAMPKRAGQKPGTADISAWHTEVENQESPSPYSTGAISKAVTILFGSTGAREVGIIKFVQRDPFPEPTDFHHARGEHWHTDGETSRAFRENRAVIHFMSPNLFAEQSAPASDIHWENMRDMHAHFLHVFIHELTHAILDPVNNEKVDDVAFHRLQHQLAQPGGRIFGDYADHYADAFIRQQERLADLVSKVLSRSAGLADSGTEFAPGAHDEVSRIVAGLARTHHVRPADLHYEEGLLRLLPTVYAEQLGLSPERFWTDLQQRAAQAFRVLTQDADHQERDRMLVQHVPALEHLSGIDPQAATFLEHLLRTPPRPSAALHIVHGVYRNVNEIGPYDAPYADVSVVSGTPGVSIETRVPQDSLTEPWREARHSFTLVGSTMMKRQNETVERMNELLVQDPAVASALISSLRELRNSLRWYLLDSTTHGAESLDGLTRYSIPEFEAVYAQAITTLEHRRPEDAEALRALVLDSLQSVNGDFAWTLAQQRSIEQTERLFAQDSAAAYWSQ